MALIAGRGAKSAGGIGLALVGVLGVLLATPGAQAKAPGDLPTLRLIAASDHLTVVQTKRFGVSAAAPVYVASAGGSYELWVERERFSEPYAVTQVVRDAVGEVSETAPLPMTFETLTDGLPAFTTMTLTNTDGDVVKSRASKFCPNSYLPQRVNDKGPENPTYPEICYPSPFTSGMVWGIDKGWAASANQYLRSRAELPVGSYELTVEIAPIYQQELGLAEETSTVAIDVTIVNKSDIEPHHRLRTTDTDDRLISRTSLTRAPAAVPGNEARPDLVSLPAWGMSVQNRNDDRSFLRFGATVWNAGPSPLVVEGFREAGTDTMRAFQYFYENGTKVGRAFSGRLEYDHHDGHDHWHFRDFAAYSLLDENKEHVVRSGKEAFCLAPTDLIDLTVNGAEFRPFLTGLATACGESDSLWIREVLATGWGDTYAQYRPGQSFNITRIPNGKYFVQVLANPDNRLYESRTDNNIELRRIFIKGPKGERRVVVPPYRGIDTEGSGCGAFC